MRNKDEFITNTIILEKITLEKITLEKITLEKIKLLSRYTYQGVTVVMQTTFKKEKLKKVE